MQRLKDEHRFLLDASGRDHIVSIVGIDEGDLNRRYISWKSPLARALMKAGPGDRVVLRAPKKTEPLEILDVAYVAIPMDPFRVPPGAEAEASTSRPPRSSKPGPS